MSQNARDDIIANQSFIQKTNSMISSVTTNNNRIPGMFNNIKKLLTQLIYSVQKVKPVNDSDENNYNRTENKVHTPFYKTGGDNNILQQFHLSNPESEKLSNTMYIKCLVHELRTPISNISIGLQLLKETIKIDDVQDIIKETNESMDFLKNILSKFAMVQDDNITLNSFEPFSFQTMMAQIETMVTHNLIHYNVGLCYHIHHTVALWNYGDSHNITHVIINLLQNSIKYRDISRVNTVTIDITGTGDIPTKEQHIVCISIKDQNNHLLPHIKENLFQAFNTTSGSGMGLYICKTIVELHGGEISHHFLEPVGNEFIIILPLRPVLLESIKNDVVYNVLHVDDSELNRKLMTRLLQTVPLFGDIYLAEHGANAMATMNKSANNIHVVMIDKNMPVMNGYDAVKAMRAASYNRLIIGLTGEESQEDIDGFIICGADFVMVKPFDGNQLKMIRTFIEKYGTERRINKEIRLEKGELQWLDKQHKNNSDDSLQT